MKRLILMFVTAMAVTFGSQAAFAQHNQAQTAQSGSAQPCDPNHHQSKRERGCAAEKTAVTSPQGNYPAGPNRNKEYPASLLANAQPFMPKDTKVGVGWMTGKPCDQNGNFVSSGSSTCQIYISHTAGKTYISRRSQQEGDRIFIRNGSTAELYVQFAGGTDIYRIVHQSPAAQQFASASGYRLNPQDNTMVPANGAVPAPKRTVNCKDSGISVGDRIACASGTVVSSDTAATTAPPAPAQSATVQKQDCSKLTMVARIKCEAMAVAGK